MDQDKKKKEEFTEYARQSDLPPLTDWPSESLHVVSQRGKGISYSPSKTICKKLQCLPTNGCVVHIKGPLFEGKLMTRIRNENYDQKYFNDRSRQYNWIVVSRKKLSFSSLCSKLTSFASLKQGRFLQSYRFDEVTTGQEFERPFRNAPSSQIVHRLLGIMKSKLPDSFECDFLTDKPFFEHPLLAGCQHFRIDNTEDLINTAENELYGIDIDGNVVEDTSLLQDVDIPRDGAGRRKFFSKSSNLSRFVFDPCFVYTFDFFSNFFNPNRFSLEIGPLSFDILPYFNGYPLFLSMAKVKSSGEMIWATEIWHKRLLNYEETPGRLSRWC